MAKKASRSPKKGSGSKSGSKRGFVKNRRQYEGLRRKGMSKARAAKITNAGKKASRKGGKRSRSRSKK